MTAIGSVGTAGTRPVRLAPRRVDAEAPVATGRSLIAVEPAETLERPVTAHRRTLAPLVAHLIAMATDAPQTRMKRRAEPAVAVAAYGATARLAAAPTGTHLRAI